jgi:integrase
MVLLAYRHGPRACELVDLDWSQADFKAALLRVRPPSMLFREGIVGQSLRNPRFCEFGGSVEAQAALLLDHSNNLFPSLAPPRCPPWRGSP